MIADCCVMVGTSINGYELEPESLLNEMDRLHVDISVIVPVQPKTYCLEPQNDYISMISKKNRNRLIGFARVDPRLGKDSESELERCVYELGLKGLFLHPWEEGYRADDSLTAAVAKRAGLLKIPVVISAGFPWVSHALQIGELAKMCPDTTIIMTHGGQLNISGLAQNDAFTALKDNPNILMNTTGVYRQDFIKEVIASLGCRRVLFGSGSPVFNQEFELERAKSAAGFNAEAIKRILGLNLIEILNTGQYEP